VLTEAGLEPPLIGHLKAMTDALEKFTEREEIEMLLPWYVTGRLEAAEQAHVTRYLENHPDMQGQLQIIQAEQDHSISANQAIAGAPAGAFEKLRASVAAESNGMSLASVKRSIWAELQNLFTVPTPRAVQWAGVAAAVVMVVQAAIIGGLLKTSPGSGDGSKYQTASGPNAGSASTGTRVLIQFAPSLTNARLSKFLRSQGAEIVAGPKPGGIYEVRISTKKLSQLELDVALKKMKSNQEIVLHVLPQG